MNGMVPPYADEIPALFCSFTGTLIVDLHRIIKVNHQEWILK